MVEGQVKARPKIAWLGACANTLVLTQILSNDNCFWQTRHFRVLHTRCLAWHPLPSMLSMLLHMHSRAKPARSTKDYEKTIRLPANLVALVKQSNGASAVQHTCAVLKESYIGCLHACFDSKPFTGTGECRPKAVMALPTWSRRRIE